MISNTLLTPDFVRVCTRATKIHPRPPYDGLHYGNSDDFAELSQFVSSREDLARKSSISSTDRTRRVFRELFLSNIRQFSRTYTSEGRVYVPVFCTFTFAKDYPPEQALDAFGEAAKKMQARLSPSMQYLAVLEPQKSGRPHIHAVFSHFPRHTYLTERESRTVAKIWGHGFVDVKLIRPSPKLVSYLTKYLTKNPYNMKGKKRYTHSRLGHKLQRTKIYASIYDPRLQQYITENNLCLQNTYTIDCPFNGTILVYEYTPLELLTTQIL